MGQTDGQTDGRTPDRCIDHAPNAIRAVPIRLYTNIIFIYLFSSTDHVDRYIVRANLLYLLGEYRGRSAVYLGRLIMQRFPVGYYRFLPKSRVAEVTKVLAPFDKTFGGDFT